MKKQYLSSFVAGRGILVSCTFMCFSLNFQTNSCGLFCLPVSFFPNEIAFSSILRIKTIFFGRHSILRKKIVSSSFQFWTDAYTDHIWRAWYKQLVLFSLDFVSGEHQHSRENKTNCFPEGPDIQCFVIFLDFHFKILQQQQKDTLKRSESKQLASVLIRAQI